MDEEDRPAPRAQVALWTRAEEPLDFGFLVLRAETDDAGSAVFRELEAGQYLLVATLASGTRFQKAVQPLELHLEEAKSVCLCPRASSSTPTSRGSPTRRIRQGL